MQGEVKSNYSSALGHASATESTALCKLICKLLCPWNRASAGSFLGIPSTPEWCRRMSVKQMCARSNYNLKQDLPSTIMLGLSALPTMFCSLSHSWSGASVWFGFTGILGSSRVCDGEIRKPCELLQGPPHDDNLLWHHFQATMKHYPLEHFNLLLPCPFSPFWTAPQRHRMRMKVGVTFWLRVCVRRDFIL